LLLLPSLPILLLLLPVAEAMNDKALISMSAVFGHRAMKAARALGLAGPFKAVAAAPERGWPISVAQRRSTYRGEKKK